LRESCFMTGHSKNSMGGARTPPVLLFAGMCALVVGIGARGESLVARPGRIVTSYALTAPAHHDPDDHDGATPKDWRLLGSNDDGRNWQIIDIRTNEVFSPDHLRRVFEVTNHASYNIYRLVVDRTRDATDRASLAECELIGPVTGLTNEAQLKMKISSSRSHPLIWPATEAFDGDPNTDWIDFGLGGPGGRWLQCQYTTDASIVVENIAQLTEIGRSFSSRDSYTNQVSLVLSNSNGQIIGPARKLVGYSLTSANDFFARDPTDWQLLGSSDGETWDVLDVRRNETFPKRLQRRYFVLQKPASYAFYRLQIDSVFAPADANSVQLEEIEPHWAQGEDLTGLSLVVSARRENPPWESIQRAFDRDLTTKWLDFSPQSTNRASWVQWQFAAMDGPPVVSLNNFQTKRPHEMNPVKLDLQAVVVGRDLDRLTLVDRTGYGVIQIDWTKEGGLPGERIRLKGDVEFVNDKPLLWHSELTVLGRVPNNAPTEVGSPLEANQNYGFGTVEGEAEYLSQNADFSTIRLASSAGTDSVLVRIVNPNRRQLPNPLHCRLQVRGVVESVLDEGGHTVPGVVWVSRLSDVSVVVPKDGGWDQWPEFSIKELVGTNSSPSGLVRISGTMDEKFVGRYLTLTDGTNRIVVYAGGTNALKRNARIEAAGFLRHEGGRTFLLWAIFRPATDKPKPLELAIDEDHPVIGIGAVNRLRETKPDLVFPARVRGVVTYISASYIAGDNVSYLQDGTNVIPLLDPVGAGLTDAAQQEGLYIEITGQASRDGINPTAFAKFLGKGRMPEPARNPFAEMLSPQNAGRWTQVEGVVSGYDDGRLTLLVDEKDLTVWVNQISPDKQCLTIGSRLRISGVCDQVVNGHAQMLGLRILVPSTECIEVVKPAPTDPFSNPKVAIANVLLSTPGVPGGPMQMVWTEGVVTYKGGQMLCLQDKDSGIRVYLKQECPGIAAGDQVQAAGLALPDGFSPKLIQAVVRKVGQGELPAATKMDFTQAYVQSSQDATRGQVDAIFEGQGVGDSVLKMELRCEATRRDFFAYLPANTVLPPSMLPGARVRLLGVIKLQVEEPLDANQVVTAFEMYLSSASDIKVLAPVSWWTTAHTLWLVGGLAGVLIVSLGWISSLRRQVRRQLRDLQQENAERKRAEIFLNSVLQNLPVAVVIKEVKDLRIVMLNKAYEELTGIPKTEALGQKEDDFALQPVTEHDREAIAGNKLLETEAEMNTRSKGKRIVVTRRLPVLDEKGQPLYLMAICDDVTQQKVAQAELAYERDLLRTLLENTNDLIYFKDRDSRITECSRSYYERFGVGRADVLGKTDADFQTEACARTFRTEEQAIMRTRKPLLGAIEQNVTKNGKVTWYLSSKMPFCDKSNAVVGIFGISKDITAIKEAEAKLEAVHKELLTTSRLAGMAEVATSVLHNVGNVLNSANVSTSIVADKIRNSRQTNFSKVVDMLESHANDLGAFLAHDPKGQGALTLLTALTRRMAKDQEEVLQELASLTGNIEHIKEIVSMQQNYARVYGVLELHTVTELIEDSLCMSAGSIDRDGIQIVRDFAETPPVLVDKHKVLQILVNLIRNARYALEESHVSQKLLTLRVRLEEDFVSISVNDNGVGIAPENLTRIFSHGFTTRENGHGFGLHSGALAAKDLNGSLNGHSDGLGKGATFTLRIPCQQGDALSCGATRLYETERFKIVRLSQS
jgi:PAS domain S-box-containing protein